jgi:subtilase family serine protease
VQHGGSLTAQVTVCNQGTQSDTAEVEVYLSADATIRPPLPPNPPEDSRLGSAFISNPLYPGQCTTVPVSGSAYAPPPGYDGPYHVGAVVDPFNSRYELIEDNNTNSGYRVGIGSRADFVVTSVTGPNSVKPGVSFTASATVCNRGRLADTTDVDLYLSADNTIRLPSPPLPPEDFYLGRVSLSLGIGACATRQLTVTAPSVPDGAYYLGAVADPTNARIELIEDNNAYAVNRIGVGSLADFVVTAVTGPSSTKPGASFTANVTVCNRGQLADMADVAIYLSADNTIRLPTPPAPPEDFYLGTVSSGSLGVGACISRSLAVTAPSVPEGAYYLGAVADPASARPELIEDNNTYAVNRIGVGIKPDFQITSVTGPTSVQMGASFTANVTVCNRGQLADAADVELYFSANTTIRPPTPPAPPEDHYLGMVSSGLLNPGACITRSVVVNAYAPNTGSYYLGAVADPYNARVELIEDNNTRAGTLMSVTP